MQITHLGHSCMLVEAAGARILIDPGAFSTDWHGITGLDALLITHQHPDHVDPRHVPALVTANPHAQIFTADDVDQALSLPGAVPLNAGDHVHVGEVEVRAVGGAHAVIHADIPRIRNLGYVLSADGEPTFFHPGDSLEVPSEETALQNVKVLALPLMGPWAAMKEQVEFVRALGVPPVSIPIHDELLSDRGRELLNRQIGNLTGTEIISLRGGPAQQF